MNNFKLHLRQQGGQLTYHTCLLLAQSRLLAYQRKYAQSLMSGTVLSDSRDRGMRLRRRRTVLGDISNSTAVAAPIAQEKPQKQNKRAVSYS